MRNCTRDGGGPFEVGNQVLISSHRKLLSSKAAVVNIAETLGHDLGRQGWERRAQANRCRPDELVKLALAGAAASVLIWVLSFLAPHCVPEHVGHLIQLEAC
jgi:hypothetical protein